ncbi:hypothetical protein Q1695_000222 [Nippostrongylus brasiliensis]|nr:hypothetical protein Q1695_000222 [Nippostrongylus brasiliensis]
MVLGRRVVVWRTVVRNVASANQNLIVRAGLAKKPEKTLFIDGERVISYGDFQKHAGSYASVLSGTYDVSKGDRVLCRTSKTLDSVALYMACVQLGAIYIPVNPQYTQAETEHYVKDSTPRVMVTCDDAKDKVFRERIPSVVNENKLSKEVRNAKAVYDVEHVKSDDVACVCYTSGTTGLPKGAMLTHGSLSSNAEALVDAWRFTENDKLLHMLPFYHVHGMFISLNCSLFSHSSVIWRERFSVDDCLKCLPHSTVMMGVPTFYSRLLSSTKFNASVLQNMRLFVSGSAPLSTPVWEQFHSRTGHEILERYGMTEAQVICSNLYDDRRPGKVGKPIGDTKLRLNENGGVEIKSSALFGGYWMNPTKTAQEFTSDGYFITGDIGAIDKDGFVSILGRGKDLVISGGFNIYPKEVEDCLDRLPNVKESAVIGVPDEDLGEVVAAVVCLDSSRGLSEIEKEREIITALKDVLAHYKVPRRVFFLPQLPRNSMAKVQKNLLREQYKFCEQKGESKC